MCIHMYIRWWFSWDFSALGSVIWRLKAEYPRGIRTEKEIFKTIANTMTYSNIGRKAGTCTFEIYNL